MMGRDRELHEMADEGRAWMSDYIKRVDALDVVAYNNVHGEITLNRYDKIIDGIYAIQSADVAPVRHGMWVEYGENKDGTHNICCSVCDGFFKSKGHANSCYTRNKYRYCHNCGARMDGDGDDD